MMTGDTSDGFDLRGIIRDARYGATWLDALVWACVAICCLYPWYRYPFRLSDAGVSPTYADTPTLIQVGKYVLLAPLVAAALAFVLRSARELSWRDLLLLAFACVAGLRSLALAVDERSVATADVAAPLAVVAPVAIAAGIGLARSPRAPALGRAAFAAAGLLAFVHLAANLVHIALWTFFDRAPAFGYVELAAVRFGGLWDDPNSTAAFCAGVLVVLLARTERPVGRWRAAIAAAALVNFVLAQSFSAAVILVVGIGAVLAIRRARSRSSRPRDLVALAAGAGGALAVLLASIPLLPVVLDLPVLDDIFVGKERSLRLRLEGETWFSSPGGPIEWLFGSNAPRKHENAFGTLLAGLGLLGLGLLLAWLVATVLAARGQDVFVWLAPLLVAAAVGSLFVPYLTIFPAASLAVLALGPPPSRFERPARGGPDDAAAARTAST